MASELVVERRSILSVSPEAAFAWHVRPGALERMLPPWMRLRILERTSEAIVPGSRVRFRIGPVPGFSYEGLHEHIHVEPGRGFTDVQLDGLFDRWVHHHRFEPVPGQSDQAVLIDRIECALPFGIRLGRRWARRELERMLRYRHAVTGADLAMHARSPSPPLRIGVTGASGFIGSLLTPVLTTGGHRVRRMVRRPPRKGELQWAGRRGFGLDPNSLVGLDAIVHLAGENVGRRWTAERKRRIRESRVAGTGALAQAMAAARAQGGPGVLVSVSAVGYYGDRGDEVLTEASPPGTGFLAEVGKDWEAATAAAAAAGIRVVRLRIGLPLSPAGGLLERMLLPFRFGLGGRLGSGIQWMSWIGADDLLEAFVRVLSEPGFEGPVNAVAPEPVRNRELTRVLGRVLKRPARLVVPATALRLGYGEMADEALLASARVMPAVLLEQGHRFRHPDLEPALRHLLGR